METDARGEAPTPRLSFSKLMPKLQLAWDSSSLASLKRCPRYYEYNIIQGYVSKPENVHLRFGTEYNNAIVTYCRARIAGRTYDEAVLEAVRYALVHTWDATLGRPWVSDLTNKTRETLLRTVVWYLDQFENDPLETVRLASGSAAVSLDFNIYLEEDSALTGEAYSLCGELDRVVAFAGANFITDWKTSKHPIDERYFAEYTPNTQVSQYTFAGNIMGEKPVKGVIIDAVQLGVNFSRFQRSQITRTPAQLEEWLRDSLIHIRENEAYVQSNYWPQRDAVCGLYGGCPYRQICSLSPEFREAHLKSLYTKRLWDPLTTREI